MPEFPAQPLETCKADQRGALRSSKPIEGLTPFRAARQAKGFVCKLKRAHLRICNAVVIDDVLRSKAFDLFFQPGGL